MSAREKFTTGKVVKSTNFESDFIIAESAENVRQQIELKNRFIPLVNYESASNFSFFGSAKEYYAQSLENIINTYPYDGSKKEIAEFLNESNYIDLYIFNNLYPRFNGYVNISSNGWGSLVGTKIGGLGVGVPNYIEYISVKGGPHTASSGMANKPLYQTFDYSNKYDTDPYSTQNVQSLGRVGTRESNLKTNFNNGVTVEFWARHESFNAALTDTEIVFDLWNGEASSSLSYGRLAFGFFNNSSNAIALEVMSGSVGTQTLLSSMTLSDITDGNWHHYAFVFQNSGSNLMAKSYYDGGFREEAILCTSLGEISKSLTATIGALNTNISGNTYDSGIVGNLRGAAKLSGSLDEFRFWKSARTAEQIVLNYTNQVGGGSNDDISNVELGLYYKFNEGITGTSSYDSIVLDYSGRISNGRWVGYPGSSARSTESGMKKSGLVDSEFKDPVIYSAHPEYKNLYSNLEASGSVHDDSNPSMLLRSLPAWIVEEDETNDGELKKLVQVVSNTFDQILLLTQHINEPKNKKYETVETADNIFYDGYKTTYPFANSILESFGLSTEEIFENQTLLEFLEHRNKDKKYSLDLNEIKNQIYKNIYNNLNYLYSSKGTEKSVRNMLRCLGISEEILNLNIYSNGAEHIIENRYYTDTFNKNYINFYGDTANTEAVITQVTNSTNPNTDGINYVYGQDNPYGAFTTEIQVMFPKRYDPGANTENNEYFETSFITASVLGLYRTTSSATQTEYVWRPSTSVASGGDTDFQILAIRPNLESSDAYFKLTNRSGSLNITSSLYKNVYSNQEWNFAVRIYNNKFPFASTGSATISGSSLESTSSSPTIQNFTVDFLGYNTVGDYVKNNFILSSSLDNIYGQTILTSNKRYAIGAQRQNYTGSLVYKTDIKVGSLRHYDHFLENEAIKSHSIDKSNYGFKNPEMNSYLFNHRASVRGAYLPKIDFNTLNIDFELVTGSDQNGRFSVLDFSSGSLAERQNYPSFVSSSLKTQYEFSGFLFAPDNENVVSSEIVFDSSLRLPEVLDSKYFVNILERDDELFIKEPNIQSLVFALEKSYYGTISKEIVNFYGDLVSFNNIIGQISNRYHSDYKSLNWMKKNFFDRLTSQRGIDKFYEFYKWIDDAIINFVKQLIPVSANMDTTVRDIIESHILERNKIKYQYPILDTRGNTRFAVEPIEGTIKSTKELKINWRLNTPPILNNAIDTRQSINKEWWINNVLPTADEVKTGVSQVDLRRLRINNVIKGDSKRRYVSLYDQTTGRYYNTINETKHNSENSIEVDINQSVVHGGVNTRYAKDPSILKDKIAKFTDNQRSAIRLDRQNSVNDYDDIDLQKNTKVPLNVTQYTTPQNNLVTEDYWFDKAESIGAITFVSESRASPDGYQTGQAFKHQINNLHGDFVGRNLEIPMQGPFTEQHVGGNQHRHQGINTSTSSRRPEQFKIVASTSDIIRLVSPQGNLSTTAANANIPYLIYYRDETAKRPVNIKNILTSTSSSVLGNYKRNYEVLQTYGRKENNLSFVYKGGFETGSVASGYFYNFFDYTKPDRSMPSASNFEGNKTNKYQSSVIVNRFSSPGGPEVAGDNQGGLGLDYESAEYSPYNNINFRNLTVRIPLNRVFLKNYSDKFGIASGSNISKSSYYLSGSDIISASYHKINRNDRYVVAQNNDDDYVLNTTTTKVVRNNAFVSTPIPAKETQYSWIANSYERTNILNYQQADGYVSSSNGLLEAITFVSSSKFGSYVSSSANFTRGYGSDLGDLKATIDKSTFIPDTLVPINLNIVDPINTDSLTTGLALDQDVGSYINKYLIDRNYISNSTGSNQTILNPSSNSNPGPGLANILNAMLLNRNGAYGYPVFKQIRNGETKIVNFMRNNNILKVLERSPVTITLSSGSNNLIINSNKEVHTTLIQSPVSSRYKPIKYTLLYNENGVTNRTSTLLASHGNEKVYYYDKTLNRKLNLENNKKTPSELLMDLYKTSENVGPVSLEYSETIFPKEQNSYLSISRNRINFTNNYWLDNRLARNSKGIVYKNESVTNPLVGYNKRSSWDLDVFEEFERFNFSVRPNPSVGPNSLSLYGPSGILQNYTTYMKFDQKTGASVSDISASSLNVQPTFARPHMERLVRSVVSPWGMDIYNSNGTLITNNLTEFYAKNTTWIGSGYAKWEAGTQAGKFILSKSLDTQNEYAPKFINIPSSPFYNGYDEFQEDVRLKGKDMAILPEFRASDFAKDVITNRVDRGNIENFLRFPNEGYPTRDSTNSEFFEIYTNSEILEDFELLRKTNKNILEAEEFTLKIKGLKKFMPYDGFYPAERTVQLAKEFFDSYKGCVFEASGTTQISDTNKSRPLLQTLFAPGIVYNSIKSGIAVDYPVMTSSYYETTRSISLGSTTRDNSIASNFSTRVPFEAIYSPNEYLDNLTIYDNETSDVAIAGLAQTNPVQPVTDRLYNKVRIDPGDKPYLYAINNFLAETENLFLRDRAPSSIKSLPEEKFKAIDKNQTYGMRIKMFRTLKNPQPLSGTWGNYQVPQTVNQNDTLPTLYLYFNKALFNGVRTNATWANIPVNGRITSRVGDPGIIGPDASLSSLQLALTMSHNLVSYNFSSVLADIAVGNTTNLNTDTTFTIDNSSGSYTSIRNNLETLLISLEAAINSGSSFNSFKAENLGEYRGLFNSGSENNNLFTGSTNVFYPEPPYDVNGTSIQLQQAYNINFGLQNKDQFPEVNTYGVLKITANYSSSNGTTFKISSSANPSTYVNSIINKFCFASQIEPERLSEYGQLNSTNILTTGSFVVYDGKPKETFTMYSRPTAFGPPVAGISGSADSGSYLMARDSTNGFNWAFTPPYYYGESWIDVIYVPSTSSDNTNPSFTPRLDSALGTGEESNNLFIFPTTASVNKNGIWTRKWRFDSDAGSNPGTDLPYRDGNINDNSMQLDASLIPFAIETDSDGKRRWAIKTKFETPMLNFNHLTSSKEVFYPNGLPSGSVPRGIWHQFGRIPASNEGVYIQVTDIPKNWLLGKQPKVVEDSLSESWMGPRYELSSNSGPIKSLVDVCGFPTQPVKLGEIADFRKFKEAVIAVPFVEENGEKRFFTLDRNQVNKYLQIISILEAEKGSEINDYDELRDKLLEKQSSDINNVALYQEMLNNSVSDMVLKMKNFILPPQFDFIANPTSQPISMYIFNFEFVLDKDDLSYIWQNLLPPSFGKSLNIEEIALKHPLFSNELMGDWTKSKNGNNVKTKMPKNVRWMVFKVKQKGLKDYTKLLYGYNKLDVEKSRYSFNWPYDNFSIVEMAKIDASVMMTNNSNQPNSIIEYTDPDKSEYDSGKGKRNSVGIDPNSGILTGEWNPPEPFTPNVPSVTPAQTLASTTNDLQNNYIKSTKSYWGSQTPPTQATQPKPAQAQSGGSEFVNQTNNSGGSINPGNFGGRGGPR